MNQVRFQTNAPSTPSDWLKTVLKLNAGFDTYDCVTKHQGTKYYLYYHSGESGWILRSVY